MDVVNAHHFVSEAGAATGTVTGWDTGGVEDGTVMGCEGTGCSVAPSGSVRSFTKSFSHLSIESSLKDLLQHGPQQPAVRPPRPP